MYQDQFYSNRTFLSQLSYLRRIKHTIQLSTTTVRNIVEVAAQVRTSGKDKGAKHILDQEIIVI